MYGGAEEGYEVYMFPVPHEEEGHRRTIYPRKDPLALTKDRFVLYCLLRELLREPCPPVFPRARTGRR